MSRQPDAVLSQAQSSGLTATPQVLCTGLKQVGSIKDEKVERILATGAVRDRGVIIYISEKRNKPEFCISCFDNKIGQDSDTDSSVKEI